MYKTVASFNIIEGSDNWIKKFIVLQYFKRDADELESWIYEKLQAASDESYKDPTNLQVRIKFLSYTFNQIP